MIRAPSGAHQPYLEIDMSATQFARHVGGIASVTAGTTQTQGGAAALTGAVNLVTTGNANDGVRLPADRSAGDILYVVNHSNAIARVYPSTGGAINGGSTNAHVNLRANSMGVYLSLGGGNWGATIDNIA
jgi:hypothetical protein